MTRLFVVSFFLSLIAFLMTAFFLIFEAHGSTYGPDFFNQTSLSNCRVSNYSSSWTCDKAFDENDAAFWSSDGGGWPDWIEATTTASHVIKKYAFKLSSDANALFSAWTLYGSNNNSTWTQIDARTGESLTQGQTFPYEISSTTPAYNHFKFEFTTALNNYVQIDKIYGYECTDCTGAESTSTITTSTITTTDAKNIFIQYLMDAGVIILTSLGIIKIFN